MSTENSNTKQPCTIDSVVHCYLCGGELFMRHSWGKNTVVCKKCSKMFYVEFLKGRLVVVLFNNA